MASVVKHATTKLGNAVNSLAKVSACRTYYTYVNEPAQPLKGKEPKWTTAENAFEQLKSGKNNYYQEFRFPIVTFELERMGEGLQVVSVCIYTIFIHLERKVQDEKRRKSLTSAISKQLRILRVGLIKLCCCHII